MNPDLSGGQLAGLGGQLRWNTHYAVETRNRYLFQVGVASVNDYTKPAIEFASNNKIPLLSLSWFLSKTTIDQFNSIDQHLIDSFNTSAISDTYNFLKDRGGNLYIDKYRLALEFLREDNIIGDIVTFANTTFNYSFVGLLETGDMVFLFARTRQENNILNRINGFTTLKAEIHWFDNRPNVWRLTVISSENPEERTDFDFYVPKRIFAHWQEYNLSKAAALDIKQEFFSKIFVFNGKMNPEAPFSIINIDREWLDQARKRLVTPK